KDEDFEINTDDIEWKKIAQVIPGRSALECLIQWKTECNPSLNKSKWTKEEDVALSNYINEHGFNYDISKKLNTNRTPLQCFMRYQSKLNPKMCRSKWTPKEDEELRRAVKVYGEKNWQQVAHCLEGRTGQ